MGAGGGCGLAMSALADHDGMGGEVAYNLAQRIGKNANPSGGWETLPGDVKQANITGSQEDAATSGGPVRLGKHQEGRKRWFEVDERESLGPDTAARHPVQGRFSLPPSIWLNEWGKRSEMRPSLRL